MKALYYNEKNYLENMHQYYSTNRKSFQEIYNI